MQWIKVCIAVMMSNGFEWFPATSHDFHGIQTMSIVFRVMSYAFSNDFHRSAEHRGCVIELKNAERKQNTENAEGTHENIEHVHLSSRLHFRSVSLFGRLQAPFSYCFSPWAAPDFIFGMVFFLLAAPASISLVFSVFGRLQAPFSYCFLS